MLCWLMPRVDLKLDSMLGADTASPAVHGS